MLDVSDKDYLSSLDGGIEVLSASQALSAGRAIDPIDTVRDPGAEDRWLRECRTALVRCQVIEIDYRAADREDANSRQIEPICLFYYSLHWHLIAWCRLREDYRDFRLDRIQSFQSKSEQFARHSRATLKQYLAQQQANNELLEVELLFSLDAAKFAGEQRFTFGFVGEESTEDGVVMSFLTSVPDYMARWLLQFAGGVRVLKGEGLASVMRDLSDELSTHWRL